jgi:LmbE family N-acetylglucosaminyl deacetylase
VAKVLTLGWSEKPQSRLILRRAINRMATAVLRLRSRLFSTDGLLSIVVFAPHPDDETLGCGGLLALMARNGPSPHVVFLTDGAASHPLHSAVSPGELGALRRTEAREATALLGIESNRVRFLDARDGMLGKMEPEERDRLIRQIVTILRDLQPDAILLPCRSDGSSEHNAAFLHICRALEESGRHPRVFEYPVWSLWNSTLLIKPILTCRRVWRVDLDSVHALKDQAAASYRSQVAPIPPDFAPALPPEFVSMLLSGCEFLFEHGSNR